MPQDSKMRISGGVVDMFGAYVVYLAMSLAGRIVEVGMIDLFWSWCFVFLDEAGPVRSV